MAGGQRPSTVGDCRPGGPSYARPCPWIRCRYHLLITEIRRDGTLVPWRAATNRRPGGNADAIRPAPWGQEQAISDRLLARLNTMPHTCALDVVADCPETDRVSLGRLLGIGDWAVREAERQGMQDLCEELNDR